MKCVSIPKKRIISRKILLKCANFWRLFRKQSFAFYFTDKIQEKILDKESAWRYDVLNVRRAYARIEHKTICQFQMFISSFKGVHLP